MANATDAILARYQAELEEKKIQMDGIIEAAQEAKRDVRPEEMEHYNRCKERMQFLDTAMQPLREGARIAADSSRRTAELQESFALARNPNLRPTAVEYRSAGAYLIDRWQAGVGVEDAKERLGLYHRAAAHQTTADNLGIIPEPVIGPVLNFIDTSRPGVNAVGVTPMPGGRFAIPTVTQHTDTGKQTAEKAELTSRKMLITKTSLTMDTYGGYVNVSRQDIDWSVPQIMDMVVNDLAGQYAIDTETATCVALKAASVAQTPALTTSSTAADVNTAVWKAVGTSYAVTPGQGRFVLLVSPDMMGVVGPLFPAVNPTNANSSGFLAANLGSGEVGSISGIGVVMTYGLAAGTILLLNATAARCFEQRLGALQVTEPSVLGVQVAYAGYFQVAVVVAGAIIKLTV